MANKSLFENLKRIQDVARHAHSRLSRRNDELTNKLNTLEKNPNGLFNADDINQFGNEIRASKEAYKLSHVLNAAEKDAQLKYDLDNLESDGKRFYDEVINFQGPRWQYAPGPYKAPRRVRQKDIRDHKYDDHAYNLNDIPSSIQSEFIDKVDRPTETEYSAGVYGVNGKTFRNKFGDIFYVPNSSNNVLRY